ncbi:MAG: M48 family metalloprotease [Planctomycetes bacterium]|nr:M48 family metalloprotease [Planctomycetota bacterium]
MPFLLLICLMAVCLPINWPDPPYGIGTVGSVLFTGMLVICLLLAAGTIARQTFRRLEDNSESRNATGRRYGTVRTWLFFANLFGFGISLLGFGWASTAIQLGTIVHDGRSFLIPGGELLILAPFLIVQIGSWFFYYDADRAFHDLLLGPGEEDRFWSRRGYVFFLLRQQMVMVLAPLVLLMGQQGVERFYPEIMREAWLPFASLLVLPAFLLFFPLVLPIMLGLKPMPAGETRQRLLRNSHRLGFRFARLYHWDTRGAMANAMVVGIVPWIRYVIFTDRLLEEMSDDEVDAVLGHEVGHVRHGHMLYYAFFLMISFIVMGALLQAIQPPDVDRWREYRSLIMVAPVVFMGSYMFAAFGFISRRCERQADIFGCRAGSCSETFCPGHDEKTILPPRGEGLCITGINAFIRALRRVEDINGLNREKAHWRGTGILGKLNWIFRLLTGWLHTWQHSTIDKRIAFLEKVARDPEIERRFQRRVWLVRCGVALILIGAMVGLGLWKGWSILLLAM